MENPYSITIHCDGAMDYDSNQTGGNGFVIDFPECFEMSSIFRSIRNDGQGIHRLEMISIIESMKELIRIGKNNPGLLRKASGVSIYTDRIRVTDNELTNPYKIQGYRKNNWKNHEDKPIKDKDLLDDIDKTRKKLTQDVGGRVEIIYKREKGNKIADKLSKVGKKIAPLSRSIIRKKNRQVSSRKFDGSGVNYSSIEVDSILAIRVYAWELVQNEYELSAEILDGVNIGKVVKIYVNSEAKKDIHRQHCYKIEVNKVYSHHIKAGSWEEFKLTDPIK